MIPRRRIRRIPTWPLTAIVAIALTFVGVYFAGRDWPLTIVCAVAVCLAFRLLFRRL